MIYHTQWQKQLIGIVKGIYVIHYLIYKWCHLGDTTPTEQCHVEGKMSNTPNNTTTEEKYGDL